MYQKGKPHGIGRYDWADGSYYEGEFREGYREGRGVFQEHNGCLYKGKEGVKLAQVASGEISSTGSGKRPAGTAKSTRASSKRGTACTTVSRKSDRS
jgi:hypothetical protein